MNRKKLLTIPILLLLIFSACASLAGNVPVGDQGIEDDPDQKTTELAPPEVEEGETMNLTETVTEPVNPPTGAQREFSTEFSISAVPFDEILAGGPVKDGIPPIDDPQFISIEEANQWLDAREPVILVSIDGEVKAYPIQILMWHEIVNDTLGGGAHRYVILSAW